MSAHWDDDMLGLARRLGARLKQTGRHWIGPCPAGCATRDGFVVTPKAQKFLCRPAKEGGGAVSMVMHVQGCSKEDAVKFIRGNERPSARNSSSKDHAPCDPMKSWRNALSFRTASAAHRYLMSRGIEVAAYEASSLRCSPALWHWESKSKWPALLARVALADGTDLTVHQTFIKHDGSGKAPLGDKARLFPAGSKTVGGGVWFGEPDPEREFIVGEGVESVLAAMRIFSAGAGCAALSAFGVSRLILPPAARIVRIFADHDAFGQGLASARVAAQRWRAEGREVTATMSPTSGEDANDVWLRRRGLKIQQRERERPHDQS